MKHFLAQIFKVPMFLVFLLILALYGLPALGQPAEVNRYAIVTALGIDQVESEDKQYEISLLTFIPVADQNFKENYKVISAKGKSLSEALDYAGLHVGREIGLSHIKTVVLNQDLFKEDITIFLDYLSRNENLSASTKLVSTDVSAKDFLNAAKDLDGQSSIQVNDLINFNANYIYAVDSSFELFYKGFFGPTKVSTIPYLTVSESDEGISVAASDEKSENSEKSGSGSESSGGGQKDILNDGDTLIFKDGKMVTKLTGDDMKKINFIKGDFNTGTLEIKDFTDENFNDSNLIFEIMSKSIDYKVKYENEIPIFYINCKLSLNLAEVENEDGAVENNFEFFQISKKAMKALETKVKNNIYDALEIMRDNQIDIVDFYTELHNTSPKAFKNFLEKLDDKEDYLNRVVFKVGVNIFSK